MRTSYITALAAVLALGWCGAAGAETPPAPLPVSPAPDTPPTDPTGFTAYAVAQLQSKLVGWKVTSPEPLNIRFYRDNPQRWVGSYLKDIYEGCSKDRADCAAFVATWADGIAAIANPLPDPDRAKLWALVLPGAQFDAINKNTYWRDRPVAKNLQGNLHVVCQLDRDRPLFALQEQQLDKLGLSDDAAIALCVANTVATQPAFAEYVRDLPPHGIGTLSGPNEATLFLFHDGWGPLAARFGEALEIAIPNGDTVLYAHGADAQTANALLTRAMQEAGTSRDGPTPDIFRWTRQGWEIVPASPAAVSVEANVPLDESAFLAYFISALSARMPEDKIGAAGRLVLRVTRADGADTTLDVAGIQYQCARYQDTCDKTVADFVDASVLALHAPDPQQLRVGLFPAGLLHFGYGRTRGMDAVDVRTFGEFWERCYKKPPKFEVPMTRFDREDLKLSNDDAIALCEKDTRRDLPALSADTRPLPGDGIGTISAPDESAALLFAQDWSALAARLGGELIVAAPTRDLVLFARGGSKAANDALAARADYEKSQVDVPLRLSHNVYRWSPYGWKQETDLPP
jgi:hypothetical protein